MKALSFLPLNHIFERMVSYLYFFRGTSVYFAESLEKIGDNLKEVSPQMFTTVPYLLEKVYEKIMMKGKELQGIKRKLFFWANDLATKFEINKNQGLLYNMQLSIANKLIFKKWREGLGGEIKYVIRRRRGMPGKADKDIYRCEDYCNGGLWLNGNFAGY